MIIDIDLSIYCLNTQQRPAEKLTAGQCSSNLRCRYKKVYLFSYIVYMITAGRSGGDNAKPAPSCVLITDAFPVAIIDNLVVAKLDV